jgi:hypothetical protein
MKWSRVSSAVSSNTRWTLSGPRIRRTEVSPDGCRPLVGRQQRPDAGRIDERHSPKANHNVGRTIQLRVSEKLVDPEVRIEIELPDQPDLEAALRSFGLNLKMSATSALPPSGTGTKGSDRRI